MGGGLESRYVGSVYGADGAVRVALQNIVVLSYRNDGLTSIKFSGGKDTRTYGRISLPPAKEIWRI